MKSALLSVEQQFTQLTSLAIRGILQQCRRTKSPFRLFVIISPPVPPRISSALFDGISRLYCQAFRLDPEMDVRFFLGGIKRQSIMPCFSAPVDVVFTDNPSSLPPRFKTISTQLLEPLIPPAEIHSARESLQSVEEWKSYNNVVIGGTFDHLHAGHKLLLSNAILRCNKRLTIGITVQSMLKKKHLADLIQPLEERTRALHEFCADVDPSVEYHIVPISDPFGPSIVDADLEAIVASEETLTGAEAVNIERRKKDLPLLQVHTFPVHDVEEQSSHSPVSDIRTISSSWYRQSLLGRLLKAPIRRPYLSSRPYLIGLTGGSGSGKSQIGEYLSGKEGVLHVDCDKIAHEAYRKGTPLHARLVEQYGKGIVDGESGEIVRKELGKLVFGDPIALERMNSLIWPEVMACCRRRIKEARPRVAFVDAALLLEAGWALSLHEVWAVFVPEEEAVRRIIRRDGVSEEYARARIRSQMSNQSRIQQANVVLCSLWDYPVTHAQVDRAWQDLCGRTHSF